MNKVALKEALLELARIVALAVIPLLIDGLYQNSINLRLVGITGAVAGLRFIDKYLHSIGKQKEALGETTRLTKGLTRF